MTSPHRLPTGALSAAAAAMLAVGALWWTGAAPASPPVSAPGGDMMIVQFENGATLIYPSGTAQGTFPPNLESFIVTQWPCQVARPGEQRVDLLRGFDFAPRSTAGVLQLPRCTPVP